MYRKLRVNVILNSETVGAFPLRSGARKLLFNIILDVLIVEVIVTQSCPALRPHGL